MGNEDEESWRYMSALKSFAAEVAVILIMASFVALGVFCWTECS